MPDATTTLPEERGDGQRHAQAGQLDTRVRAAADLELYDDFEAGQALGVVVMSNAKLSTSVRMWYLSRLGTCSANFRGLASRDVAVTMRCSGGGGGLDSVPC